MANARTRMQDKGACVHVLATRAPVTCAMSYGPCVTVLAQFGSHLVLQQVVVARVKA